MGRLLIGMNPLDHEVIWNKMYRDCFWGLNGGPIVFGAMSAFDIALWDIKGKYYKAPLYQLLGGKQRSQLHCYASQLQNDWDNNKARSLDDYRRVVKIAKEKGFDSVKVNFLTFKENDGRYSLDEQKAFMSPEYLKVIEDRIRVTREELGDGYLILENHCYSDKLSAVQVAQIAEKYHILYNEEPTPPYVNNLKYIHDHTHIPVASGERIYSRWQYKDLLEKDAIQVIQPDLGTCGGISEVKKICDMSEIYDVEVQIHVCGSPLVTYASLHMEAAIKNFVIHEYNINTNGIKMTSLIKENMEPVNGYYSVPEGNGIGNEIADETFKTSEIVALE